VKKHLNHDPYLHRCFFRVFLSLICIVFFSLHENQLVEKQPDVAIVWFWKAINSGDRVDSALKDMAMVMKQQDRSEEAIEAIRSFRHLCSKQAQESLDNLLIDLYKVHTFCLCEPLHVRALKRPYVLIII
jgi:hypothetical protein